MNKIQQEMFSFLKQLEGGIPPTPDEAIDDDPTDKNKPNENGKSANKQQPTIQSKNSFNAVRKRKPPSKCKNSKQRTFTNNIKEVH